MNKQVVVFLLLIINISAHGMDGLHPLTERVLVVHHCDASKVSSDINALSLTNKFLYEYYTRETTEQFVVSKTAHNNKWTDFVAAKNLGCKKVQKKINYFCRTACDKDKEFTRDDLKEHWYFNSSMIYKPLLHGLIIVRDINKIRTILVAGVVIDNKMRKSCQALINDLKMDPNSEQDAGDLATITKLFKKKDRSSVNKQFFLNQ